MKEFFTVFGCCVAVLSSILIEILAIMLAINHPYIGIPLAILTTSFCIASLIIWVPPMPLGDYYCD